MRFVCDWVRKMGSSVGVQSETLSGRELRLTAVKIVIKILFEGDTGWLFRVGKSGHIDDGDEWDESVYDGWGIADDDAWRRWWWSSVGIFRRDGRGARDAGAAEYGGVAVGAGE